MSAMFDNEETAEQTSDALKRLRRNHRRAAIWWFNAACVVVGQVGRELKRYRKQSGAEYIMEQLREHPLVFRENYRLSPALFRLLCDELRGRGLDCGGDLIIEEHVGMFLQMVGAGATIRKIATDFQHSEETVWRSLRQVLGIVVQMRPDYMKLPGTDAPIHRKLGEGTSFNPFKAALGAIDGTHINAYPDSKEKAKERWRNRKGLMTQNVMAVCDFDGRFLGVVAGWEGSAHDSLVLRKSLERGFFVPEGRYYLVDGGYANTHQFLSPYRGHTYHLASFRQCRRDNRYDTAEELFNHRHAQLRNIIEKTFGLLKSRFKICKEMHSYKYDIQVNLVVACCVLHNFIKQHQNIQDENDDESDSGVGEDDDASTVENPSPNGTDVSRGSDAQRGAALRDAIRDELWNNFHNQR